MKMNVTLSTVLLTGCLVFAAVTKSSSQPLTEIAITGFKPVAGETAGSLNDLQTAYPLVYKKLVAAYSGLSSLYYTVNNNLLYLHFKNGNKAVSSVYAVNGKMKYAVTSLGKTLPQQLLEHLKNEFPDHTLFCGRHIQLPGTALYHIILESCHEYLVLNYSDEEITAVKTIKK